MPRAKRKPIEPEYVGPPVRLQKLLAQAGLGSRRECEVLIEEGRVRVDGKTAGELGCKADPATQSVDVDGEAIHLERPVTYMLFKPQGYLCTAHDELGRDDRLAVDLLPPHKQRLFTVGRLDKESEGLILATNDGEVAQRIAHPRHQVPKTYRVVVRGMLTGEDIERLEGGMWLAEGRTAEARVSVKRSRPKSSVVEVTLREGKNREVRRLFAKIEHPVSRLTRIAIGPLTADNMKPGDSRKLTPREIQAILDSAGTWPKTKKKKTKKKRKPRFPTDATKRKPHATKGPRTQSKASKPFGKPKSSRPTEHPQRKPRLSAKPKRDSGGQRTASRDEGFVG